MSLSLAITKAYPGFTLDIALEAGRSAWRCSGPQVAAKVATLRCIAGVETPDKGRIVVNGITFFDSEAGINLSPQERKCALLFQNYQLFPNLTVGENVCAGMDGRLSAEARLDLARRYLAIFGMAAFADRFSCPAFGRTATARGACSHDRGASRHLHV